MEKYFLEEGRNGELFATLSEIEIYLDIWSRLFIYAHKEQVNETCCPTILTIGHCQAENVKLWV